jgi:diacylglycerol kinase (ATP)
MDERSTPAARLQSFVYAARGLASMLRDEPNAMIHLAATIAVIGLAAALGIPLEGWRWLIVSFALVWCAEAANTALERLADATSPDPHPLVGAAKDIAAGGVLIAATAAAAIGLLVLGPPLLDVLTAFR